jgi:succinyl-CoA synthetase alpha subunit
MSIFVTEKTRVVIQGITGSFGARHTQLSIDYGSQIVAGVTPGKGGQFFEHNGVKVPIFDTVADAMKQTGAQASAVFVPPPFAADAILEGVDAGIDLVVAITEGIPVRDMVRVKRAMRGSKTRLIGPNCPGVITPDECKIGIMPGYIHTPANQSKSGKKVGIISRSGTLTYEAVWQCSTRGIGQTTCVGIGGDPIKGLNFIELLDLFNKDKDTDGIIMIGEIGGTDEADAARWVKANVKKPVVGFIAGRTAPAGKRMGHAGAIISGGDDTADAKIKTFKECGVTVSESPATIGEAMSRALGL